MQPTDKTAFASLLVKVWRFYEKTPDREQLSDWYDLLAVFPMAEIATAFKRHLSDPKHGSYLPKPADIFRHLPHADDGRPGADEAWGLLLRVIRDERETGLLTEEMRAAWETCQPILDQGDEIGARMAFRETYTREVENAQKIAVAPRWTPTLGTDPTLRQTRLTEAVQARRIGVDTVRALLPGPTPTAISRVAGLLEGPDASPRERETAERLKQLAQILHHASAQSERRRSERRQQQQQEEAAKKAAIRELLDQHQRDHHSGREAV